MTPAAPLKPEFKFSVKNTNNQQVPEPIEDTDYYRVDKFDCIVAFEIHVSGHEDDSDIEQRAYEAILNNGDLECSGVMMKEKCGTVDTDMDGELFDRDVWIKRKTDELKIIRKEKSLLEFMGV